MLPVIYHPVYSQLELPEGHRYPIYKYRYLYEAVRNRMVQSQLWDSQLAFCEPEAISLSAIKACHDPEYVDLLVAGQLTEAKMRRIGFPWSQALIERTRISCGGTWLTVRKALEHGRAVHMSGGYHHAHRTYGSGFCLFNDLVIAADCALREGLVDKVMIIDCDVHQGDGSATLCSDRDDIVTISFHCEKNFPSRKPSSDIDIPLPRHTSDSAYLEAVKSVVDVALNLYQPDLVIYDAGVDIHSSDELGHLNVSTEGLLLRDEYIFDAVAKRDIPIAAVVGGGYRSHHRDLTPLHLTLLEAALRP